MARCMETAVSDGVRHQCRKDNDHAGNHWAIKPKGLDLVWTVTILPSPKRKAS